ncbi:MAG: PaaI family thioesterase [Thermodesulfobacteriota bacterium]
MTRPLKTPWRTSGRKCYLCGPENPEGLKLKFYRQDENTVTAEVYPPQFWCGWDGLMHGGLQCALLDEVTAWALTGLRDRRYFLTTSLAVKYRRPVRLDQKLRLVGCIVQESERGSEVLGQIQNEAGLVLSEATAKVLHLDREKFRRLVAAAP